MDDCTVPDTEASAKLYAFPKESFTLRTIDTASPDLTAPKMLPNKMQLEADALFETTVVVNGEFKM
jgi:hypothetical protein